MSLRIALYSPGMVGLGHVRRNLMLARQICADHAGAAVLLLTEAREASVFQFPAGADCISLPALRKDAHGVSAPRHLPLALVPVVRLRSAAIHAALATFQPDVLIVDHLPRGAHGELESSLAMLRRRGRTRLVLGLRDVLDDAATVEREWRSARTLEAIEEFYEAVWIYGDPTLFDAAAEYSFPAWLRERTRYTGYLDPRAAHSSVAESVELLAHQTVDDRQLVLCQLGGGQDGLRLADAFTHIDFPTDTHGILLTGPFFAAEERALLRQRGRMDARLEIVDFIAEPMLLLQRASAVITMGGYNSICEVLAFRKRALVIPRALPRCEQRIRAERLARHGLVEMLPSEDVTAAALDDWLQRSEPLAAPATEIRIDGLAVASHLLSELLQGSRGTRLPLPERVPQPVAIAT